MSKIGVWEVGGIKLGILGFYLGHYGICSDDDSTTWRLVRCIIDTHRHMDMQTYTQYTHKDT